MSLLKKRINTPLMTTEECSGALTQGELTDLLRTGKITQEESGMPGKCVDARIGNQCKVKQK